MYVTQLTITLDNRVQTIGQAIDLLALHCINIRALSFTERGDHSLLHLIVNDTEKGRKLFAAGGLAVTTTPVLVIEVPDKPGGLAGILRILKSLGLQVSFLSAFSQRSGACGLVIISVDQFDPAVTALQKAGINLLSHEELFAR